jgi:peptidoglycan hydrolase-like protein with peptidoglycan-binding domain
MLSRIDRREFIKTSSMADEVSGIQGRLCNLGFACGPVDGKLGPRTRGALRRFQSDRNLSVSGQADNATRDRLKQESGG